MRGLIALILLGIAQPCVAQTPPPAPPAAAVAADPALTTRANELIGIVAGTGDFDGYFSPSFHAALSKDKWDAVVASMTGQMGKPLAVVTITPVTPFTAYLRLKFERGIVNAQIAVDPAAPHAVTSLLFTGGEVADDSFDKLKADFRALPGKSGFIVHPLDDRVPPHDIVEYNGIERAPLGSAFKLWVLGELTREINAGERHWADVVPLGPPSLPSGMTQSWPAGSPVTLQTLATLMISISDNTATDTLVTLEGTKLDAFGPFGLGPVPTTRQMFALKSPANADLAARWAATFAPATRRKLLDDSAARLATTAVDTSLFSGRPVAIDTLEWFASPGDVVGVLDMLRRRGGETALAILAINPGTDAATRARFDYVGFKGGSEPGVITLNYLVRRKDGRWLAVAGNWHRADARVDELAFSQLMTRALVLASNVPLP
ncbi:MAG: serine hydrolase [Sphingomonas sp.]|uniref:serine hydrolase n=1 Tax=Sphingomonas sp. TaxID=28214 RepID=UPI0012020CC2|nr:serine hydrolase [Sphingomonas sp.]THD34761.1 MAG: serine hydrolase [Sphingomonas sp.]